MGPVRSSAGKEAVPRRVVPATRRSARWCPAGRPSAASAHATLVAAALGTHPRRRVVSHSCPVAVWSRRERRRCAWRAGGLSRALRRRDSFSATVDGVGERSRRLTERRSAGQLKLFAFLRNRRGDRCRWWHPDRRSRSGTCARRSCRRAIASGAPRRFPHRRDPVPLRSRRRGAPRVLASRRSRHRRSRWRAPRRRRRSTPAFGGEILSGSSEADPATAVPLDAVKHVVEARPCGQSRARGPRASRREVPLDARGPPRRILRRRPRSAGSRSW